jgi:AcrR family transcriptional regulator
MATGFSTPASAEHRIRADARRNYDRLLAAASATVAEQGAEASMEEIARRAHLGSTTLHRHFPTRQTMLEAVFHDRIATLCARAHDLLKHPDPETALVTWLRNFVTHAATQRGLAAALTALTIDEPNAGCRTMIHSAGGELLIRAQQAGRVRPDIAIADLLKLTNAIALVTEQDPRGADQADQMLAIVTGGLTIPKPTTP